MEARAGSKGLRRVGSPGAPASCRRARGGPPRAARRVARSASDTTLSHFGTLFSNYGTHTPENRSGSASDGTGSPSDVSGSASDGAGSSSDASGSASDANGVSYFWTSSASDATGSDLRCHPMSLRTGPTGWCRACLRPPFCARSRRRQNPWRGAELLPDLRSETESR